MPFRDKSQAKCADCEYLSINGCTAPLPWWATDMNANCSDLREIDEPDQVKHCESFQVKLP